MITVVDPDAARLALSAGDLACPEAGCAGTLRIWSAARARHVQLPGGQRRRLRPVGRSAPALTAQAVVVAGAAGDADACCPRPMQPCSALASAVNALAAAARAFKLVLTRPRLASAGGPLTGIDYLAILAERHRRQLLHGLRLADPTEAAAALSPWQTINVITAGRLLTARSG